MTSELLQRCVLHYGTTKGTAYHKMSSVLLYLAEQLEEDAISFNRNGQPHKILDGTSFRNRLLEAATYAHVAPVANHASDDKQVCD